MNRTAAIVIISTLLSACSTTATYEPTIKGGAKGGYVMPSSTASSVYGPATPTSGHYDYNNAPGQ